MMNPATSFAGGATRRSPRMCLCAVKAPARRARAGAPAPPERATRAWRSDVARRFSPPTTKVGRRRPSRVASAGGSDRAKRLRKNGGFNRDLPHISRAQPLCPVCCPLATGDSHTRTSTMAGLGDMAGLGATLPDRDGGGKKKGGDSDDEDPDVRPRELARLCVMPHPETTRRFRLRIAHLSSRLAPSKPNTPGAPSWPASRPISSRPTRRFKRLRDARLRGSDRPLTRAVRQGRGPEGRHGRARPARRQPQPGPRAPGQARRPRRQVQRLHRGGSTTK